jgi:hypothetical protein
VLSSDNEAPSRPAIPPLPLLLRDHPAWLAREEAKAKTRSTPAPACETSPRAERPPVPPFPAHLHNNNNDISEGDQPKVTTAAVSAIAAPMSPPPPARPPRPTRLQAAAKQRSYYPTSHRDRQLEVSEQLARWNQFYDSTSRKVRDNNAEEGDGDGDDYDDSAVTSPGTRGVASPKPPSHRPPPVPPARQTVSVPTPTSCPAAIQSSSPSPSSSSSSTSSPTGSGSHPLRDLREPEDTDTTSAP